MPKTTKTKRLSNAEIAERITDRIIEQLEAGTIPWHKPWNAAGHLPMNIRYANSKVKRPYRGINPLLLAMSGYGSPYWMTYNQAETIAYKHFCKTEGIKADALADHGSLEKANKASSPSYKAFRDAGGGGIKAGEKSTTIVFWRMLRVEDKDKPGEKKMIPLARFIAVFNYEQTFNLGIEFPEVDEGKTVDPIAAAEDILAAWDDEPTVTHGGDKAYYRPSDDSITLPNMVDFDTAEDYYFTRFHEGVHATGHASRLNRPEIVKSSFIFGDEDYSAEELVAEMGSAMLGAVAGIDHEKRIENSAAYIKHWLTKLRDDRQMVMKAAQKAQKAVDYITGTTFDEDDETETNQATLAVA